MAIVVRIILTTILSVANIIVEIIVNHRIARVLIFNFIEIPSLEKYDFMYGPKNLLERSFLRCFFEEFM